MSDIWGLFSNFVARKEDSWQSQAAKPSGILKIENWRLKINNYEYEKELNHCDASLAGPDDMGTGERGARPIEGRPDIINI